MNSSVINCIVVEDEMASRKVIEHFIAETEILNLIQSFSNPKEAFKFLQLNSNVDLMFLDINMPEQQGIDFYKSLNTSPPVIFTTAYPQYAVEGFEVNAIDYLLKPIPYERFLKAIKKVVEQLKLITREQAFLTIKENKTLHKVDLKSIIYLEASGDYVKIVSRDKKLLTHSTFTQFISGLPNNFLRIHKSYCINTDHLSSITGNQIVLGSFQLPLGATYKNKVLQSLNL
jgi:DNA-binding LytR/AlgR family response regulator